MRSHQGGVTVAHQLIPFGVSDLSRKDGTCRLYERRTQYRNLEFNIEGGCPSRLLFEATQLSLSLYNSGTPKLLSIHQSLG